MIHLDVPSQWVYSVIRLLMDVLPTYHEGGRKYHVTQLYNFLIDAYEKHMLDIISGKVP